MCLTFFVIKLLLNISKRGHMNLKSKLGKRIQELRLANKLKQSELAEIVGIATKTQSCIETGKNYPSSELVERYAKAFNVDVSEVLNISHVKEIDEIYVDIQDILKNLNKEELNLIYKIIKSILR